MKSTSPRWAIFAAAFTLFTPMAQAHPGHFAFDYSAGAPHPGHANELVSLLLSLALSALLLTASHLITKRRG
jgi:hypothetical protein